MLLRNLGYKGWSDGNDSPHGHVVLASGRSRAHAVQAGAPRPDKPLYMDPQLYLLGLDPQDCSTACANLVTYPWFADNPLDLGDEERGIREQARDVKARVAELWASCAVRDPAAVERRISSCLTFQRDFGVSSAILPAPGPLSSLTDLEEHLQWMDIGIAASRSLGIPCLATVCLRALTLSQGPPDASQLLEAIADHVTARDDLAGIYLLMDATGSTTVRLLSASAVSAILYLCHLVGGRGQKQVFVNFVETLGVACLALGATAFATGYSNRRRRLSLEDFAARSGGRTYPKFYAHATINDYRPASDMERLRDARLLRYLSQDRTDSGGDLLDRLAAGNPSSTLPSWAETPNNITSARNHYFERLRVAVDALANTPRESQLQVLTWLQDAERDSEYLSHRFEGDPVGEDARHTGVWRAEFESMIA